MNADSSGNISSGMAEGLLSSNVETAETFRLSLEEAKTAERDRVQSTMHRRRLLESLRDSVGKAGSRRELFANRERLVRFVRDGITQKFAEECQHILRSAQILKHNRQLSAGADQLAAAFARQFKVFYEKNRLLKQTEERLEQLLAEEGGSASIDNSINQIRELASKVRKDIQEGMQELLRIFENLDQQVERDAQEEESIRTLFCACLACLDIKKRNTFLARFQETCANVPAGERKNVYKRIVEELAKNNEKVARRLHELTRKKAREHLRNGNPGAASAELCAILRLWQKDAESYRLLYFVFLKSGEIRNACIALEEAARLSPGEKDLYKRIADGWIGYGDSARACIWYRKYLDSHAEDTSAAKKLAKVLCRGKKFKTLLELIQDYNLAVHDTDWMIWKGVACFQVGKFDEAITLLHPFRHNGLLDQEAVLVLASALRLKGNYMEAISLLKETLQQYPDNLRIHILLGACYNDQGNWWKSEVIYERIIEEQKEFPQLFLALAETKRHTGKNEEVIHYMQRALSLNPSSIDLHLSLGRAYKEGDNCEKAEEVLLKALEIESNHPEVCKELSTLYTLMGEWKRATEILKNVETKKEASVN